jgi:hypothetical protein
VLDSLTVKRKAHLKPVNSANGVFHIEAERLYQHPGTLHDVRLPSVQFDRWASRLSYHIARNSALANEARELMIESRGPPLWDHAGKLECAVNAL